MKKIALLLALAILASVSLAACKSGPSDDEIMAQQIESAMQQYQVYAQAYVQQQQAQQALAELEEKVARLQPLYDGANLATINLKQEVAQLRARNDPSIASLIQQRENAASLANSTALDYKQQLDDARAQMEPYQKQLAEATKVIDEMKARADAAAAAAPAAK
jgi:chromosome segregation ATPase